MNHFMVPCFSVFTLVTTMAVSSSASEAATEPSVMERPSFGMTGCGTTIFFPFVTNRSNFDTAIVISNTSADPHGTRHQSGECILRYHGSRGEGQADDHEADACGECCTGAARLTGLIRCEHGRLLDVSCS